MLKVYVAGSLFNEAEVAQRKKEGEILRATFPQLDIFNPIDNHLMRISSRFQHLKKFMMVTQKLSKTVISLLQI